MRKTLPITVSGGFHNAEDLLLRAKISPSHDGAWWVAELSESQLAKISRHMCGMSDCCCGGEYGDVWEAPDGWERDSAITWAKARREVTQ